jgi:hypothetical protein
MSRDDYTPRGLSDPESHLELAGQRQRPHFDVGTGSEPVAPSPNQQGQNVTLNAALEVDMLRHKLRTLENLVERYGISPHVPSLSEAEEARALQYRCECLESACRQQNMDVARTLKSSPTFPPPQGYSSWLDHHLMHHDRVTRSLPLTDSTSLPTPARASFKCVYEQCVHYIYGFSTQLERDNHLRSHSKNSTSDSELTMRAEGSSNTSELLGKGGGLLPRDRLPPIHPPATLVTANLPPLPFPTPSTASTATRRDHGSSFSFSEPKPVLPRSNEETTADPQLPPLKRARVGHDRLKSIGELKLIRNNDPCLRCRASNRPVSTSPLAVFQIKLGAYHPSVTQTTRVPAARECPRLTRRYIGASLDAIVGLSHPLLMFCSKGRLLGHNLIRR